LDLGIGFPLGPSQTEVKQTFLEVYGQAWGENKEMFDFIDP